MIIATIGFTRSSAESFFGRLKDAGLPVLVDVRLHNTSQLAGFAKRDDLAYLVHELCSMAYHGEPLLRPDDAALRAYRAKAIGWDEYAKAYRSALESRRVESELDRALFDGGAVLLCSEATPERCHRRLAAEYLAERWENVEIKHL